MTEDRVQKVGNLFKFKCVPKIGTVIATPGDRAIARVLQSTTAHMPESDAEIDLMGDCLFSLTKRNAEVRQNVPPERATNKALIEWVLSNPEFEKSRWATIGNLPAALASATVLWESITTDDALKEALEKQREAEEKAKEAQKLLQEMAQAAAKGDDDKANQLAQQAEQAEKEAQDAAGQALSKVDRLKKNPMAQGMMSHMAKQAGRKGQEVAESMAAWGIGGYSAGNAEEVDKILNLLSQSKSGIQRIAELAGRLKGLSARTIEQTKMQYIGPVSEVSTTRNFLRMFPTERNNLSSYAPPYMRAKTVMRYAQEGLIGYKPKNEGKKQGSFVAAVDGSGSMGGVGDRGGYSNEMIAKALSLGLAWALRDDKESNRYYELFTFGDMHDDLTSVTSKQEWDDHLRWASESPGGGTDFDKALNYAMDRIEYCRDQGFPGTDLMFITDGYARMSQRTVDRWLRLSKETGARMFFINIGGSDNSEVHKLAYGYVNVQGLSAEDAEKMTVELTDKIAGRE